MKTLIDKINYFENGEETVEVFNNIFPECRLEGYYNFANVVIGEPCSPETSRQVYINVEGNEITIRHNFKPKMELVAPTSEDVKFRNEHFVPKVERQEASTKIFYNEVNTVMSEKEMRLRPVHYYILQYLRGCENTYQTRTEIAEKLNICIRSVRNNLNEMEEEGIIKFHDIRTHQPKTVIMINEEWL
jgi:hypothetical protein